MQKKVKLYALSTCIHCKKTKELLNKYGAEYGCIDVDKLEGEERRAVLEEVRQFNPSLSFPTLICGDTVIVGYREAEIKDALNLSSEVSELHDMLRPTQEKKGYYFNSDEQKAFELLEALLINKKRYGYMSCPCRLASGDRKWDEDIICPCVYREPDVQEYGSCYCTLYVSKEWNEGKILHTHVPERRPTEKYLGQP